MFVGEEQNYGYDSRNCKLSQSEDGHQADQQQNHDQMKTSRDPQRLVDAKIARNRVQPGSFVKVEILASVKHIEAGAPEGDGGSQQQDARIERAADGDPGSGRRYPHGESQNQMRPASESFGVGVEQNHSQREGRKDE